MPNPVSSANPPAYGGCDPSTSSCADSPSPALPTATNAPVVTINPVVITGDAGAQELLRRYDSRTCSAEKHNAAATCPGIGLGLLNTVEGGPVVGIATALHASLLCGKELRSVYDCNQYSETLKAAASEVIDDCHERGGFVKPGASVNEIQCEVTP